METLGRILTKVKDPIPLEERPGIVYNIKCIYGDFYTGETGRSLTTRMKEHKAACRLAAFERSAVAEHAWQAGHKIEWDVKILDTATDVQERKVKEHQTSSKGLKMNRDREISSAPFGSGLLQMLISRPTSHAHRGKETGHHSESDCGLPHVTGSTTTDSTQRTSTSSQETYSNLEKKQTGSTMPPGVSDTPTVELFKNCTFVVCISALMKTAVEQSKL